MLLTHSQLISILDPDTWCSVSGGFPAVDLRPRVNPFLSFTKCLLLSVLSAGLLAIAGSILIDVGSLFRTRGKP